MASVSGIEVGENVVDDQPHKFSIRATNIFRKEEGKWKLIAHHTDKVPYLGK
jgi:ketosteroid isomerase-like protein